MTGYELDGRLLSVRPDIYEGNYRRASRSKVASRKRAADQRALARAREEDRKGTLAQIEKRISGALDLVERADSGRIILPRGCRDLAFNIAEDTRVWLRGDPKEKEFPAQIKEFDAIMEIVVSKITQERQRDSR